MPHPHTAVGYLALRAEVERRARPADAVLLATAHPAKFGDTVGPAIGAELPLPARLDACLERERRVTPIAPELDKLKRALLAG